jgi:uncharacterized protein with HEPN domain
MPRDYRVSLDDILWDVVRNKLPGLASAIERIQRE